MSDSNYESWIQGIPESPDNGLFIDVGCNLGQHLLPRLHRYRWLWAFEPQEDLLRECRQKVLKQGLTLYDVSKILWFDGVALGDKPQIQKIRILRNRTCTTFLQDVSGIHPKLSSGYDLIEEREVAVVCLDFYLDLIRLSHPVVIKIDVEGWEAHVLRGAVETLRKVRPHVVLEVHSPALLDEVTGILAHEKYRIAQNITQPGGNYVQRWWLIAAPS